MGGFQALELDGVLVPDGLDLLGFSGERHLLIPMLSALRLFLDRTSGALLTSSFCSSMITLLSVPCQHGSTND